MSDYQDITGLFSEERREDDRNIAGDSGWAVSRRPEKEYIEPRRMAGLAIAEDGAHLAWGTPWS